MKLSELFEKCITIPYIHVENAADYAAEREDDTLYLYFEPSNGEVDWQNNMNFPAKPYHRMEDCVWFAHRGFLKVWKSVEPYVAKEINDPVLRQVVIAGYSHGAALAVLCHEYVWFHRPDLRHRVQSYGFGCPRVVWGLIPSAVKRRWAGFTVVRNLDDIVTHLPPVALGYTHVGQMLEIGQKGRYSVTDAHRPENILKELRRWERH